MQHSELLNLNLPEDTDASDIAPINENMVALEKAVATIDHMARSYGYTVAVSSAGDVVTTTLTVGEDAPVAATRTTVETPGTDATTYAITVTIDGTSHTMTHTVGVTTASGASTDGGGDVLPFEVMIGKMSRLEQSVSDTLDSTLSDLQARLDALGTEIRSLWPLMEETYDYECLMPANTQTKPYTYNETLKDKAAATKATKTTTVNADGTYTETVTVGENARTRVWTKYDGENKWTGVWSE